LRLPLCKYSLGKVTTIHKRGMKHQQEIIFWRVKKSLNLWHKLTVTGPPQLYYDSVHYSIIFFDVISVKMYLILTILIIILLRIVKLARYLYGFTAIIT
jgi:hypothetical protein